VPVMCETIKYKAWELATSHNMHHFMASTGWCVCKRTGSFFA